jgi:hypothetical protein
MGKRNASMFQFDSKPYITESPYFWKRGTDWYHSAKNLQGDPVYPDGTYTFVASQNLNRMQESYASLPAADKDGLLTKTATITLEKEAFVPSVTEPVTTIATALPTIETTIPAETPGTTATTPAAMPIPKKTTYASLPAGIGIFGLVIAGLFVIRRRA